MTGRVPDGPPAPPGAVRLDRRGGVLTVRLSGEVDLALRRDVQDAVVAVRGHEGPVELDLRGVTFFGAEGVRMLLWLYRAARPGTATVVATSRAVERTLRVCGIGDDVLPRPHRPG